jgi:hypothetical protein
VAKSLSACFSTLNKTVTIEIGLLENGREKGNPDRPPDVSGDSITFSANEFEKKINDATVSATSFLHWKCT